MHVRGNSVYRWRKNHIIPLFLRRQSTDIECSTHSSHSSRFTLLFKKYFLLPATFNIFHVYRPFNLPIPLRSKSILISLYLLRNLLSMCLDCHLFSANLYWPAEETSNSHDT